MKILVIGEEGSLRECKARFGDNHEYTRTESHVLARKLLGQVSLVFDFLIDEDPSQLQLFGDYAVPVFLNTIKSSLSVLLDGESKATGRFFGFNGLPSFLDRPAFEVTLADKSHMHDLQRICGQLGTSVEIVEDRPGMVTARIVCMIINEAYCAMEDGTASAGDIDIAMKLGTNYPFGPIEWSRKIGLKNVVDILDAVYKETSSERYQVCELLRDEAKREV